MARWVRVSFYGRVPDNFDATLDPLNIGAVLGRTFGFTHVDQLVAEYVDDPKEDDGRRGQAK